MAHSYLEYGKTCGALQLVTAFRNITAQQIVRYRESSHHRQKYIYNRKPALHAH